MTAATSTTTGYSRRYSWQLDLRNDLTLSAPEKLTGYTLSMHADSDGGQCFPSYETLARETGLGVRTVKRAVSALVERGYLTVVKRGGGRRHSNHYRLTLPAGNGATGDPEDGTNGASLTPFDRETVPESARKGARVAQEGYKRETRPTARAHARECSHRKCEGFDHCQY